MGTEKISAKERELFAARFVWAVEAAGLRPSPTIVQREYNRHSNQPPITSHAARKWLLGEAMPTHERIKVMADWLQVSASWLRFGEEMQDEHTKDLTSNEYRLIREYRRLSKLQQSRLLALIVAVTPQKKSRR
jgi:hypothetical protein